MCTSLQGVEVLQDPKSLTVCKGFRSLALSCGPAGECLSQNCEHLQPEIHSICRAGRSREET